MKAVLCESEELVNLLLRAGADPNVVVDEDSLLDLASPRIRAILESGGGVSKESSESGNEGREEISDGEGQDEEEEEEETEEEVEGKQDRDEDDEDTDVFEDAEDAEDDPSENETRE